jgi:hypothetical protein
MSLPFWVQCIFNNDSAYNDFRSYMAQIDANLDRKIQAALITGDPAQIQHAVALAHERSVYQKINHMFETEVNELQQQITHNQEGGKP